jgi:hypothetical protein
VNDKNLSDNDKRLLQMACLDVRNQLRLPFGSINARGRRQWAGILAGVLLSGWKIPTSGQRLIGKKEIRTILIEADDEFRSQGVYRRMV